MNPVIRTGPIQKLTDRNVARLSQSDSEHAISPEVAYAI